jgi:putative flippase GtrA
LLRFGVSGFASTIMYLSLVVVLLKVFWAPLWVHHSLAFLVCVPLSYWLQKTFTFRARSDVGSARRRFLVQAALAYCASTGVVKLAEYGFLSQSIAIAAVCVTIPAVSFIVMQLWVFVEPKSGRNG